MLLVCVESVVYNRWTGLVDWTSGLDWWTRRNRSGTRSQTDFLHGVH